MKREGVRIQNQNQVQVFNREKSQQDSEINCDFIASYR